MRFHEPAPPHARSCIGWTSTRESRDLATVDGARVKTLMTALDHFMTDQTQRRVRYYAEHARGSPPPSTPPA